MIIKSSAKNVIPDKYICKVCGIEKPLSQNREDWNHNKDENIFLLPAENQNGFWGCVISDKEEPEVYCPKHNPIKIVCNKENLKKIVR
jgi:hypothetical protein